MSKYTKFCSEQQLRTYLEMPVKDEPTIHILLNVFKKSLTYFSEKYDHQAIYDTIRLINCHEGPVPKEIVWIFIISGQLSYHGIIYEKSQFVKFVEYQPKYLKFQKNGRYAILSVEEQNLIKQKYESRQKQRIAKFIKYRLFYPQVLPDIHVGDFLICSKIKKMGFNKQLNWKEQGMGVKKIAVVYRGLISIEFEWRRRIQICQITQGMFLSSHQIKQKNLGIENSIELFQVQNEDDRSFPKFKFVSKSIDTIIIIFNSTLIDQTPFNIKKDLKNQIKSNFEGYCLTLRKVVGQQTYNKIHRPKSQIKSQIKKYNDSKSLKKFLDINKKTDVFSLTTNIKTFQTIQTQNTKKFKTIGTVDLSQKVNQNSRLRLKQYSHNKKKVKSTTSLTKQFEKRKYKNIHGIWTENQLNPKRNVKSFSNLETLTTFRPQKYQQRLQHFKKQADQLNDPLEKVKFFIPQQFVKKKLRIQYESLIQKLRSMNLNTSNKKQKQQNLKQKIKRVQQFVDSQRIVKINKAKKRQLFCDTALLNRF